MALLTASTNPLSRRVLAMLEPLSAGRHVINFGGTSFGSTDPSFPDLTVDVTFAAPEPGTLLLVLCSAVPLLIRTFRRSRREPSSAA